MFNNLNIFWLFFVQKGKLTGFQTRLGTCFFKFISNTKFYALAFLLLRKQLERETIYYLELFFAWFVLC